MSNGETLLPGDDPRSTVAAFDTRLFNDQEWSSAADLRVNLDQLAHRAALLAVLGQNGFRKLPLPGAFNDVHGYEGLPPCFLTRGDLLPGRTRRAVWVLGGRDPANGSLLDLVQTGFLKSDPDSQDPLEAVFIQDGRSHSFFAAGEGLNTVQALGDPFLKALFWKPVFHPDEGRLGNVKKPLILAVRASLSRLGFNQEGREDLWSSFISLPALPGDSDSFRNGTQREDLENLRKAIDALVRFGALDASKADKIKAKIPQFLSTLLFGS